jgi:hypothetical protein
MGIEIEVESDLNLTTLKPPHPDHAGHPYWLQLVVSVKPEMPSLAEAYAQLAAASMTMLVALSPLALLLPPPREKTTLQSMASQLSDVLADVVDFTARRAGLASGQYRIIPLETLQLMPLDKAGLRITFQSLTTFGRYNQASWRRHLAAHDVAANSVHTTPPLAHPIPIQAGLVPTAPAPQPIETRLSQVRPVVPTPARTLFPAANDDHHRPKAPVLHL